MEEKSGLENIPKKSKKIEKLKEYLYCKSCGYKIEKEYFEQEYCDTCLDFFEKVRKKGIRFELLDIFCILCGNKVEKKSNRQKFCNHCSKKKQIDAKINYWEKYKSNKSKYSPESVEERKKFYTQKKKEQELLKLSKREEREKYKTKTTPEERKNNRLKKRFGITLEDYNKMFKDQNGCCAICGEHSDNFSRKLAVDHNHKTGQIRGLLCYSCNYGLGLFKDDIDKLKKALEYLGHY